MSGSEWTSHVPIDCTSVQPCRCGADEACKYVQEIERLRGLLREWLSNEFVWNNSLVERTHEALGDGC